MKSQIAIAVAALLASPLALQAAPPQFSIELEHLASLDTEVNDGTGAEIVAFDTKSKRAFAINSDDNDLVVIDLADPATPAIITKVSMSAYGAGLNSVATHRGLVAVAVEADPKTDPGKVVFIDALSLDVLGAVVVGALPDMLTFADDGRKVLVANEGEPNSYGQPDSVNPEGSISIIDLGSGVGSAVVNTASFAPFNAHKDMLVAAGVRIFGDGATVAQDLEPEYITYRGRTAWVTLQEANAVAVVDIPSATVQEILPLGLKDHSIPGNGLDPSDRDGDVLIGNWPVFGMYQPDAIASYKVGKETFLVTANEGDSRSEDDFPGFNEEVSVEDDEYVLDPYVFPNADDLKKRPALGRLNVSDKTGDIDGDGDFDRIDVFGARSFSIWNSYGQLIWDSGDQFEQFFADPANGYRSIFNASNSNNNFDNRSDNKGPEPEGVTVGKVGPNVYAFIALERIGGVMAYDISDPAAPVFADYANTRTLATLGGDLGAEGITFVPEEDSPNGIPLVLVGNEVSGTVAIFQVNKTKSKGGKPKKNR